MMNMTIIILIALSATMFFCRCESRSRHLCSLCQADECEQDPAEPCQFGVERDYCNRKVCAKGPLELCGGPFLAWGKCGQGMVCRCNRCMGCYMNTLNCAPSTHVVFNC